MTLILASPRSGSADGPLPPDPAGAVNVDGGASDRTTMGQPLLAYQPALDGLRGVAVAAVVLFHAGFPWMTGGFLGVSTFFTLSGFLITGLLMAERSSTGSIGLRHFWVRRFRRLMPASLAALALATAFVAVAGDPAQKRTIAAGVLSCLAYVANWHFLFSHQPYADILADPSPVQHFWSLAIEEQFYLVYPLVAALLVVRWRLRRAHVALALGALLAGSLAITLFAGLSDDAVYYGTETRAAELLIGALLAIAIGHPSVHRALHSRGPLRILLAAGGVFALTACALLWITSTLASSWLYRGGLAAYALLSSAIIVASLVHRGPIRWLLELEWLRLLGKVSYAVYLYHWPVFVWLSPERTGISNTAVLFVPRIAVTLGLAILSYHFLEMPIRLGRRLVGMRSVGAFAGAAAVLAAVVVVISISAPRPLMDFEAAAASIAAETQASGPAAPIDLAALTPPFPRIAFFGDSTAMVTQLGINNWAKATHRAEVVEGGAWLGCGIGRGGQRRSGPVAETLHESCNHWERTWAQKIRNNQPNIAVVQIGPWDVDDRKLPNDDQWRAPGDPVYDAFLADEMATAVDTLAAEGAYVLWLTSPPVGSGSGEDPVLVKGPAAEPARMERLNAIIASLPERRPGKVQVIDLAAWVASTGEDQRLRPDGIHFGEAETLEVANRFLGDAIVDTFERHWKDRVLAAARPGPAPTAADTDSDASAAPSIEHTGPPRRVLVLGDTNAQPVADALKTWSGSGGPLEVTSSIAPGCGILSTTARDDKGHERPTPSSCDTTLIAWLQTAAAVAPHIVLIVPSVWDLTDVKLTGDDRFRSWGDDTFEAAASAQYLALTRTLSATGALVTWLTYPRISWEQPDRPPRVTPLAASDPQRLARFNAELLSFMLANDATTFFDRADFAKFVSSWPAGGEPVFADGISLNPAVARTVGDWLGNELLVKFDEFLTSGRRAPSR